MEKPFVVIDNPQIRITDLGNGKSEILLKESGDVLVLSDAQMREEFRQVWGDKVVSSIKHRVGANRSYSE